jgi:hypothetical protein
VEGVCVPGSSRIEVPVGPDGARWTTVKAERTVLVVAHTVTAVNRLADILPIFDGDRRIQLVFTVPGASYIPGPVADLLSDTIVIPWSQAVETEFDLALSVHHSGELHLIKAPLVMLSHGIGYTKYGIRNPESGIRKSVYGLGQEWLLHDGVVVPRAIALSHENERALLTDSTPSATDRAVLTGDPCYDRMLVSTGRRKEFRLRLGASATTTVVTVSSTWGGTSLFGNNPDLFDEIISQLPIDDYVVAAILHPNIWYGHSPRQVRSWLRDAVRSGLKLIPPDRGWQQTILASDVVIGDNGAVTGYASAAGIPTLLATFPEVVPGTAIAAMGCTTPRLARIPIEPQLHDAIKTHAPSPTKDLVTSVPGQAAERLRQLAYALMDLTEPNRPAITEPLDPNDLTPVAEPPRAFWVNCAWADTEVRIRRWPADVTARQSTETHLVVHTDHPRRDLRDSADILIADQVSTLFNQHPGCRLVATPGEVHHRDGWTVTVPPDHDPALWASALFGRTGLPPDVTIHVGQLSLARTASASELPTSS